MKQIITLAAAAAALLLGVGQAIATTTTFTTIMYADNSTSPDVDVSCKDLSAASTGVVSATCNYTSDGSITTNSTTIDLDSYLGCDYNGNLSWSETNFSTDGTNIAIELDSTGRDYWIVADCPKGGSTNKDGKALEDGLKNCKGVLKSENDTTC